MSPIQKDCLIIFLFRAFTARIWIYGNGLCLVSYMVFETTGYLQEASITHPSLYDLRSIESSMYTQQASFPSEVALVHM